jgi:HlyD family secretion protein
MPADPAIDLPRAAVPATSVTARPRIPLAELVSREASRQRRRRWLAWGSLSLVPVLAGAIWLVARPRPTPLAARFRTAVVSEGDVFREVRATGHVEAVTTVQVGAEISGKIATVEVDYNAHVVAGQVLARFDRASLAAQLAQMEAGVAAAKAALEQSKTERDHTARERARFEQLYVSQAISDNDRDNAQAAARVAAQRVSAAEAQHAAQQAAYQIARTNLEHTIIRSPIDGVVVTRSVDPGQTVASALMTPVLFTVAADLRKMRVIAAVDEADIGEVAVRQAAFFGVNAYPDRVFEGVVTEVRSSPVTVQDVVTYGTVIEVDNLDLVLKPGMTASVRVRTGTAKATLRIANAALRFAPPDQPAAEGTGAWLLEGQTLRHVPVRAGLTDGETTAIERGALPAGRSVLTDLTPAGRKAYGLGH